MAPGVPVTVWLRSDRDRDTELAREYGDAAPADPGPGGSPSPRAADAMIGFESGGRRVTTRLIAGEYIKYRSRFPAEFACRADMPAAPFIEAVRRVSLVAERGSAVRLTFGGGEVTVEAETQGRARAREIVRADFHGVEPGIAFSPHFLLDGIAAAGVSATAPDPAAAPRDPAAAAPDPAVGAGHPAVTAGDTAQTGSAEPAGPAAPKPPSSRRRRAAPAHDDTAADASPGAAGPADGLIRLEFNSSTKPAVLTGVRAPAGHGVHRGGNRRDRPGRAGVRGRHTHPAGLPLPGGAAAPSRPPVAGPLQARRTPGFTHSGSGRLQAHPPRPPCRRAQRAPDCGRRQAIRATGSRTRIRSRAGRTRPPAPATPPSR